MIELIVGISALSTVPILGILVNLITKGKNTNCWDGILRTGLSNISFLGLFLLFAYFIGRIITNWNMI